MKLFNLIILYVVLLLSSCVLVKKESPNLVVDINPAVDISIPSALDTTDKSVEFILTYKNVDLVLLNNSNIHIDTTGNMTYGSFSISTLSPMQKKVKIININGYGTLGISLFAGTAVNSKTSKTLGSVISKTKYAHDHVIPSIVFSPPSFLTTKSGPVTYQVTFVNAGTVTISDSDIVLNKVNKSSSLKSVDAIAKVTGTGLTRTITLDPIDGNGTLAVGIKAGVAISPDGGVSLASSFSTPFTVDNDPPGITISEPSVTMTKFGPVSYVVNFSDASFVNINAFNVILNTTGSATGTVTVEGSGLLTRTISIRNIYGLGTIGIAIASNVAHDTLLNFNETTANSSTFTVSDSGPLAFISPPSSSITKNGPIEYTITYQGAVRIDLTPANIIMNTTSGNASVTNVEVLGTGNITRKVKLSGISGDGKVNFSVAPKSAIDYLNNYSIGFGPSTFFTVDNMKPTVAISEPSVISTSNDPVTYNVTYTGASTISLTDAKVTLKKYGTANAKLVSVTTTGKDTREVKLDQIEGDGELSIVIQAKTSIDSVGNENDESVESTHVTVNNSKPAIHISPPSLASTKNGPVDYILTLINANTISFSNTDLTLNKSSNLVSGSLSLIDDGVPNERRVRIDSTTGDGTLGFTIAPGVITNSILETSLATTSTLFTVDNTPPVITISSPSRATTTFEQVFYNVSIANAATSNITVNDVVLNKLGSARGDITVTGSGNNYIVTIKNITGNGSLGISIKAGVATDSALNTSLASANSTTFTVLNDPLYTHSWHLKNYGQSAFSSGAGKPGIDLNLLTSWAQGYLGQGINILVSDTGVQASHEDLAANILPGAFHIDYTHGVSPNFLYSSAEPILNVNQYEQAHGTAVAGIISAVSGNGKGSSGVAPSSKIISANFLNAISQGLDELLAQVTGNFQIINQSWATKDCTTISADDPILSSYVSKLGVDRKVYVKAAGNSMSQLMTDCGSGRGSNTYHGNANFDPFNNNPYTIVVGAVNASGVKASYSSIGSSLWIAGLGGEFGINSPAIITTDLLTCNYGLSPLLNYNSFQLGTNALNSGCNYTSAMNGTSAAAPTVSGVIALLLSANNSLTTRDIKHILASTATKVDPTAANTTNKFVASPTGHVWEQGWITNAAPEAYHFHNYYGFGLINTDAAINMATQNYTLLPPELSTGFKTTAALNLSIPANDANGITNTINVTESYTIEAVQIKPRILHSNIGEVGIEITSPSGTKSIVVNVNNTLMGLADFDGEVFLTNAFYGENSAGNWTIKVIDGANTGGGTLVDWSINIIGH